MIRVDIISQQGFQGRDARRVALVVGKVMMEVRG